MKTEVINGKWTVNANTFEEQNLFEKRRLNDYFLELKTNRNIINN
ncbi:hypothetical protein [Joostella sp. CR20]